MLDAIERSDPAGARRAMLTHMDGATQRLRATLGERELPKDEPNAPSNGEFRLDDRPLDPEQSRP